MPGNLCAEPSRFRFADSTPLVMSSIKNITAQRGDSNFWADAASIERRCAGLLESGFDGNGWHQKFVPQLTALRQKARDHEDDAWLDKLPSHYTAVNQIADALVRVAQRLPDE